MSSPLLALFVRSLREDTRAKITYWARGGLAAFVLLLVICGLLAGKYRESGRSLFQVVVWMQALAMTFVGLSWFSSAITEEKEEQTLGLLRMTKLNALSILLGKSTSRLLNALLLFCAPLPFTLLVIPLGGVSLEQIEAAYVTLGAYAFLVGNLALLWSVLAPTTARATTGTAICLVALIFAAPLLREAYYELRNYPWAAQGSSVEQAARGVVQAAHMISPVMQLTAIMSIGFNGKVAGPGIWINLGSGLMCFLLAWAAFPRFAERPGERRRAPSVASRWQRPWRRALAWKDFYFLTGGRKGVLIRLVLYGGLIGIVVGGRDELPVMLRNFFIALAFIAPAGELAVFASVIFRSELEEQTWSTLTALPMTTGQIVRQKILGVLLGFGPPAVTLLVTLWTVILRDSPPDGETLGGIVYTIIACLLGMYVIAWLSLHMRRGALALGVLLTVMTVILHEQLTEDLDSIPGLLIGLGCFLLVIVILHFRVWRRAEALAGES
jgi:hypothetical protein